MRSYAAVAAWERPQKKRPNSNHKAYQAWQERHGIQEAKKKENSTEAPPGTMNRPGTDLGGFVVVRRRKGKPINPLQKPKKNEDSVGAPPKTTNQPETELEGFVVTKQKRKPTNPRQKSKKKEDSVRAPPKVIQLKPELKGCIVTKRKRKPRKPKKKEDDVGAPPKTTNRPETDLEGFVIVVTKPKGKSRNPLYSNGL